MTVSMTFAESTELWVQLPAETRSTFYNLATKSDAGYNGLEFFHHEIPDVLKSDPDGIELLLNGGDISVAVDAVPGPGPGALPNDTVTVELPDRDFSRIESGYNGGDYTPDNVVLENASINRARQSADMSDVDVTNATDSIATDADLIVNRVSDTADVVVTDVATTAESAGGALESVLECVLPVTVGAKSAHHVWKSTERMDGGDRVAVTALAGGAGVLATAAVVANPIGAACVAAWGTWNLCKLGFKLADKYI